MLYVFDIDGTISNNEQRKGLIPSKDLDITSSWLTYNKACINDEPINSMIYLCNSLYESNAVVLLTSRSREVFYETSSWLDYNGVYYYDLVMRDTNDNRKDYIIKQEYLDNCGVEKDEIVIFEDNPQVIKHLRGCGYKVMAVCEYENLPKDCESHGE